MPAKSRHGKGKRPQNRARAKQPQTAAVHQAAAVSPAAGAPAAVAATAVPQTKAPVKAANSKAVGYTPAATAEIPHFTNELKRIAIISACIVVVLVVLAIIIR